MLTLNISCWKVRALTVPQSVLMLTICKPNQVHAGVQMQEFWFTWQKSPERESYLVGWVENIYASLPRDYNLITCPCFHSRKFDQCYRLVKT